MKTACGGLPSQSGRAFALFSDAKPPENLAQKVVGGEFAGDRTQVLLGQAQLFGKQLQLRQLGAGEGDVFARCGQRPQVARLTATLRAGSVGRQYSG